MSKKAKVRRKDAYKGFLNGMIAYRAKFISSKFSLVEKMLQNESLRETLLNKNRSTLSILERAAVDTLNAKEASNIEISKDLTASLTEAQNKRAKFKYTPKKI